ncbi:MAG: hypothetical protein N3C12_02780 [Candidatus Binatia bacterium]|nr:hypothetical protein [Candidatus Binatia bacterium]
MWRRASVVVVLAAFVWCGCAGPARRGTEQALPVPDSTEVMAAFAERASFLRSLRAVAKLRYTDPHERHSARQAIAVARPDKVRVEVASMFGTAFVLAAHDHRLLAYLPEENTVYQGTASAENVWRYTRVWMPVSTLVEVLLGVPAGGQAEAAPCNGQSAQFVCLRQGAGQGGLLVALDARGLPAEVEELGSVDGAVLWRARYLEYSDETTPPAPKHLVIEVPRYRRSVSLQLSDIEVNPPIGDDVFRLDIPRGVRVVDLDEQEAAE